MGERGRGGMTEIETYYLYLGNRVRRLCHKGNHLRHCNVIVRRCMAHFRIETYSKDTVCQHLPPLFYVSKEFCFFGGIFLYNWPKSCENCGFVENGDDDGI